MKCLDFILEATGNHVECPSSRETGTNESEKDELDSTVRHWVRVRRAGGRGGGRRRPTQYQPSIRSVVSSFQAGADLDDDSVPFLKCWSHARVSIDMCAYLPFAFCMSRDKSKKLKNKIKF